MKTIKAGSSKQYVNKMDAGQCPVCKSFDISSGSVEMDGSMGFANVECKSCGSYWTDIVQVTGYSNLNEMMNQSELDKVRERAAKTKHDKYDTNI